MARSGRQWWRGAVGYEVYVRSFADSDGDGVGDLPGLRARLGHIASLGVDFLWVTPFYPSPMADHGYDVADYRGVDARFGTLGDVDSLVAEAHQRGLPLVIDLVPNHTSSEHPWFRAARGDRASPYRDHYVWRDPAPDGGPPNNWVSHFGGSAWTYDEASGQYYLHLFLPEQPDLNWDNPAVRDEFDAILRFWCERGVDGFRIDVAHALLKDPELRDNPPAEDRPGGPVEAPGYTEFEHVYDIDQPGVVEIYRRWYEVVAPYGALLLGEVYLLDPSRVARYVSGDRLHLALCFTAVRVGWDADAIRDVLRVGVDAGGDRFAWPLSSHDDARAPTRFGGGPAGARRALAYLTLLAGLPGVPILYQGDELGLPDGEVPPSAAQDPLDARGAGGGRDGTRTPMPWDPGPGLGFTAGRPWLPLGGRRPEDTVAWQEQQPDSHLHRTRRLLAVRRESADLRGSAEVGWLTQRGPLVAYRRGDTVVAADCGQTDLTLALPPGSWRLRYATGDGVAVEDRSLRLAPDHAAIVERDAS
ncbi:MAG TPA: alpha-amylase family glycosyl hydrolase [Nitriliruptorales bacterium]|nr:alpha-amylase family glycosyl hydrolase [Nitriliruptorales bacterium]